LGRDISLESLNNLTISGNCLRPFKVFLNQKFSFFVIFWDSKKTFFPFFCLARKHPVKKNQEKNFQSGRHNFLPESINTLDRVSELELQERK